MRHVPNLVVRALEEWPYEYHMRELIALPVTVQNPLHTNK